MEFIYEIENVLPKDVCEQIIERFKNDNTKHPSKVGPEGRLDANIRKSTTLMISGAEQWKDIDDILYKALTKSFKEYSEYIKHYVDVYNVIENISDEGYTINEMKVGEYYNWHVDDMIKSGQRRLFSCVLYLNTLEEDQGGCTEFWCGKKVRPKQGKVLLFPSSWTYLHRGAPVKNSGVKYTCVTWAV